METHHLGQRLTYLRKEKGWSQEQVAVKLNVTRQAVSNWERDKTQPDLEMLVKLADLFEIDLDGLVKNEVKSSQTVSHLNLKFLKQLYLANIFLVIGKVLYIGLSPHISFSSHNMILFVFLLVATTIYFFFTYAIKSGDYTMLAGYDPKLSYHYPILKKMAYMIALNCLWATLISIGLSILIELLKIEYNWISMILILVFLGQFIGGIMIINVKYRHMLLLDSNDRQEARIGTWISIGFFISILTLLVTTFFTAATFEIENNTLQAGKLVLFILPYTFLNVVGLVIEQKNIKRVVKEQRPYRLNSFTYFIIIVTLILLIGMVYTGYHSTLN